MPEIQLRSYLLSEFLAVEFDLRYVLDPLLPSDGIGIIHGKGGHGKTQFAFALTRAIMEGGNFLGRYRATQGGVLYLQFDMPDTLFQERLLKAAPAFSQPDALAVVPHPTPIDITQKCWQTAIRQLVAAYEPVLVIWDTLRKIHPFDENDNSIPSRVYEACKNATAGVASLIIHHDRKTGPLDRSSDDDPVESFRGARAWIDDSDLGIHLRKYGKEDGGKVKMSFSKLRCEPQPIQHLQMNPKTLLIEAKQPQTAQEWVEVIYSQHPGIDKSTLVQRVMMESGIAKNTVYEKIKGLGLYSG